MAPLFRRLAGFLLLAAVPVGCNRSDGPPAPTPSSSAQPGGPVTVTVVSPKKQTLTWTVEQPGSVQPFEVAPVEARVAGYVKAVNVDLGDEVHAARPGEKKPATVLAELDVPDLVQDVERKKAAVELARSQAGQAAKAVDVAAAQAKVAAAGVREADALVQKAQADVERWESELERVEKLASGSADLQLREETRRQAAAARATRQAAEARAEASRAAVAEAEAKTGSAQAAAAAAAANVKVAEADAKRAEAELGFATLTAPFDGVVTARDKHPGFLAKPGGPPLLMVARLDVVRVFVDVPEAAAAQAKPGAAVEVRVPALGRTFSGKDVTITRTAGVLNPESRTMRTEIDVKNPDRALTPGLYVTVRLTASAPDALLVPAAAVLFADETAYCFAVEDGKAVKLQVRVGRSDPGGVQLLSKRRAGNASGEWQPVTGGERIVVGNLGALADGQPVGVKE